MKIWDQLETEIKNLRDSIISNDDYESEILIKKLSEFIETYKGYEDIEYKRYTSEGKYILYNIHITTEGEAYAEMYDAEITDDVDEDILQECNCISINVNDVINMIIG